jgi:hypothetical protein
VQSVTELLSWLEATRLAEFIRESEWAFPAVESVHVIALALVIGTISIVDLRLLGLASTNRRLFGIGQTGAAVDVGRFRTCSDQRHLDVHQPAADISRQPRISDQVRFDVCGRRQHAGFSVDHRRDAAKWDRDAAAPLAGRIAATLSLVFWIAIVFFGRRIGFTTMPA